MHFLDQETRQPLVPVHAADISGLLSVMQEYDPMSVLKAFQKNDHLTEASIADNVKDMRRGLKAYYQDLDTQRFIVHETGHITHCLRECVRAAFDLDYLGRPERAVPPRQSAAEGINPPA